MYVAAPQVVVDAALLSLLQHGGGNIRAFEPACIGPEGQTAQPGAAAEIDDEARTVRLPAGTAGKLGQHLRTLVLQAGDVAVEVPGIAVEQDGEIDRKSTRLNSSP